MILVVIANSLLLIYLQMTVHYILKNITRGSLHDNVVEDMKIVYEWLRINKLRLNVSKSSFIVFDKCPNLDRLSIPLDLKDGSYSLHIEETKSQKYLGLMIDKQLNFQDHIDYVKSKVARRIGPLYRSKNCFH